MVKPNPLIIPHIKEHQFTNITQISGGLVHQVYKIDDINNSFYIKVRGKSFSEVPELTSIPSDVKFEKQGLEIFGYYSPDVFPYVMASDPDNGVLVLSDLLPEGGETLHEKILRGKFTKTDAYNIGRTLGRVHTVSAMEKSSIRDDDEQFFIEILNFRFGFIGLPVIQDLNNRLISNRDGLIIGGLSPKNILISQDGQVKFCDLETVCLGNRVFDIGYCLGHLILHALPDTTRALATYSGYLEGYQATCNIPFDLVELVRLISATIVYRTNHSLIAYKLSVDDEIKTLISLKAKRFLKNWGSDINDLILGD